MWTRDLGTAQMRGTMCLALLALLAAAGGALASRELLQAKPSCAPGHVWSEGPPAACVCDRGGNITCGLGLCEVTVPACVGNTTVATQCIPNDPPTPNQDACNGKDDDCDGLIDEDDADTWVTCGKGVCANRVKPCVGGTWVGTAWCYPRLEQATNETCDGIDNDCDGIVDNVEILGYKTCGLGKCKRTVPWCVNGTENECKPGAPRDEVCNNEDDDCDDLIDEDLGHIACQERYGSTYAVVNTCYQGIGLTCPTPPPDYTCPPSDDVNKCGGPGTCGFPADIPPATDTLAFVEYTTRQVTAPFRTCSCDLLCPLRGDCCRDFITYGGVCTQVLDALYGRFGADPAKPCAACASAPGLIMQLEFFRTNIALLWPYLVPVVFNVPGFGPVYGIDTPAKQAEFLAHINSIIVLLGGQARVISCGWTEWVCDLAAIQNINDKDPFPQPTQNICFYIDKYIGRLVEPVYILANGGTANDIQATMAPGGNFFKAYVGIEILYKVLAALPSLLGH